MDIIIQPCSESHFEAVRSYINEFDLDNRQLQQHEFLIALHNNKLAGFGRIREHADCSEMCSLGIIVSERSKGIGKKLVNALIQQAKQRLFLVCIIPGYFTEFGFCESAVYPVAAKNKLDYCTENLPVNEKYVVMQMV